MENDDILGVDDLADARAVVLKIRRRVLGAAAATPVLAVVIVWFLAYLRLSNVAAATFVAAIFLLLGALVFVHWWRHYQTILRQLDLIRENPMELKDFISTTLAAIVDGVVEAQEKVQAKGAHINPGGLMRTTRAISENAIWDNRTNNYARTVSFDVALTAEDGSKTNAKVGVVAGVFNLGAGGESANKQQAVNRVQFSIPVLFPVSELPEDARLAR